MTQKIIRRGLAATAIAGGLAGAGFGIAAATSAGTGAHASTVTAAAATPPPAGTLTALTYTAAAGSGGALNNPLGIAAANGNVYVSNSEDNVVSLLSGGTTTTFAGSLDHLGERGDGGPASAATLDQPNGVAVDAKGDVFIADTEDNVVREVHAGSGIITRVAGTGQEGSKSEANLATRTELDSPEGVAVDSKGDLFISDTYNNRVLEVTPAGRVSVFAGNGQSGYRGDGGKATKAELNQPIGLAVDSAGNLYVADASNNVVRRVDARTGDITTVAGDVAADKANNGLGGFSGDGGPATSAQLHDPQGVALDSAGDLFIADTFNDAVREVTPDGTIFTVVNQAGASGAAPAQGAETNGPATSSKLDGPSAVAVDNSTSTLYIADSSNNKATSVTGLAQTGDAPGPR